MISITHQRNKCIGCNYCVEVAPHRWRMSKKDGRSTLIDATESRGFWHVKVPDHEWEANDAAAKLCPVNIINIKKL